MSVRGKRVLITRTREQASELAALLGAAGAETIPIPTIELGPPRSFCALDAALAAVRSFDWVLFTSANAVGAFAARARTLGVMPSPRRVAAVGLATARAVEAAGMRCDLVPPEFVAESLAAALVPEAKDAAMLLVRAEEARDALPEALAAAGALVTIAPAYRNVVPAESVGALRALFGEGGRGVDAVTFTSSSTASHLFRLLEVAGVELPVGTVLASIGPVTSATVREMGREVTVEAREATVGSLCRAVVEWFGAG